MMNLLENFFHTTPEVDFFELISLEKKKYAHDLLITVIEKKEYCMSLIQPRLQNWDTERIAIVDLLLLCMGITELQFFETIPTKVTINEYIEISKLYSTRQSGPFINGVLDNIYKNLLKEDKIHKIDISKPKPPNEA
jgi:N utilization substance protein B